MALADERSRVPAVPAPVRAFLREWDRVGAEVATAGTAVGVAGVLYIVVTSLPGNSFTASILATVYQLIAGLMGAIAAERLAQVGVNARILLRRGFDVRSLSPAMQRALPERTEEANAAHPGSQRATMATSLAALGVGAASVWGLWQNTGTLMTIFLASTSVVAPTVGVRTLWAHWHRRKPEGLWNRLAGGWLGRALFRVAALGLGTVRLVRADDGEPTVLAVGGQARLAYAALAPASREALRDVPVLLDRLEAEAMTMRAAPGSPAASARLESAAAAMEMLRLDLIRLGAAQAGDAELTAAIARARDVGIRVDAMVEAGDL